jgi:glycosyltransferase involved in cell wall biosynthesis
MQRLQSCHTFEVIIVDNGSSDDTRLVLERFGEEATFPFRALSCLKLGASSARNIGWRAARGSIVAFTDDDCYPAPDFVDCAVEAMADGELGFVGGRIVLHDPNDLPVTIYDETAPKSVARQSMIRAGSFQGANLLVRKLVLEEVGGFDENLGAGTPFPCEDIDLVQRISMEGWPGRFDPRPMVAHHHRRKTSAEFEALMQSYDYGRGAFYAKGMLSAGFRLRTAALWLRCARHLPVSRLFREIRAATHYCWLRASRQFSEVGKDR